MRVNGPLYVLFDIYGNTQGVELLGVSPKPGTEPPRAERVPATAQRLNNVTPRSEFFSTFVSFRIALTRFASMSVHIAPYVSLSFANETF